MIKLIASDLDGTIISNNTISYENMQAIKDINNSSLNFAICTGKTYSLMKNACKKFNASYGIFGNGVQIIDLKNNIEIYKKTLDLDIVSECIKIGKYNNLHIHLYTETEVISEKLMYMDLRNFTIRNSGPLENSLEFKIVDNILSYVQESKPQILKLIISSDNNLDNIKSEILSKYDLDICTINKTDKYKDTIIDKEYSYLDISPKNINKAQALHILENYLNLDSSEVMAIGDNLNDLDMIKSSGIGVAVANAYDSVKNVAKYTTTNSVENRWFCRSRLQIHKILKGRFLFLFIFSHTQSELDMRVLHFHVLIFLIYLYLYVLLHSSSYHSQLSL